MATKIKVFDKKRDIKDGERFGEHVRAIMSAVASGPKTRDKVVAHVEKKLGKNTCQPASRIVSFQTPRMIEAGLIKVTTQKIEKTAPAPKKKAAAKKTTKRVAAPPPATETALATEAVQ